MLFRTDYEPILGRALLGIQIWCGLGELWGMLPKCAQCGCAIVGERIVDRDGFVVPQFCSWGCCAEFHGI